MIRIFHSLFLFLMLTFLWLVPAYAGEQQAAAQWVQSHAVKLSDQEARTIVREAYRSGERFQLDPLLLLAKMYAESTFQPKAANRSGARGLLQVVPRWHKEKIKGRNIMNIAVNIEVGAWVMDEYMKDNKDNYSRAMVKYTGGAKGRHSVRIKKAHRGLQEAILAWKMTHDKPIEQIAVYGNPRAFYRDMPVASTQVVQSNTIQAAPAAQSIRVISSSTSPPAVPVWASTPAKPRELWSGPNTPLDQLIASL